MIGNGIFPVDVSREFKGTLGVKVVSIVSAQDVTLAVLPLYSIAV